MLSIYITNQLLSVSIVILNDVYYELMIPWKNGGLYKSVPLDTYVHVHLVILQMIDKQ